MTYRKTQDQKDWRERTGSHSTRPRLSITSHPEIDPDLMEAKRKRREWLAKSNHPLREKRKRLGKKQWLNHRRKEFYKQRAADEEQRVADEELARRLAPILQQLGIEP